MGCSLKLHELRCPCGRGSSCGVEADPSEQDFLHGCRKMPLYARTILPSAGKHACQPLGTGGFLKHWENADIRKTWVAWLRCPGPAAFLL